MKIIQQRYDQMPSHDALTSISATNPHLLLVFGPPSFFRNKQLYTSLQTSLPGTLTVGATSGGNIGPDRLYDGSLQITAIHFDDPALVWNSVDPQDYQDSFEAGQHLGEKLALAGVHHVLLFSQRPHTNSHQLLQGLKHALPGGVSITGGVACGTGPSPASYTLDPTGISESRAVALGFCSSRTQISCGISSGWRPFGPARRITRCENNILHALDDASAFAMYRRYLGHQMNDWANARLLFSFEILDANRQETGLIRAVQSYNEQDGSLILTDDIQEGAYLRLMHASTNALVGGAEAAIDQTSKTTENSGDKLAFVVSCVGRRIIMGQQSDEEIEAILPHLPPPFHLAGFYAYGEYGIPSGQDKTPHILNETLSVTLLSETPC